MNITLINHSDSRGGASVVAVRLMHALRRAGHNASMLVTHKSTDDPCSVRAGAKLAVRSAFIKEHLRIFCGNSFTRDDLFKVSLCSDGIGLDRHPLVREADAVILNWVNQGMMSLKEISRIAAAKPVIWTMHDMWNLSGICHHAGTCTAYRTACGNCPLLHGAASPRDLSHRTWTRKKALYDEAHIRFVAVSSWLAGKCAESSLLGGREVDVIPNAFPVEEFYCGDKNATGKKIILMGAARLDDPVKGLPLAIEALNKLDRDDFKAVFFGAVRDSHAFDSLRCDYSLIGPVNDKDAVRRLYAGASVVLSSSLYETLPGTLIEGQAAGCTPVCFDSGGQRDIIDSRDTGILVSPYDTDALARALSEALDRPCDPDTLRRSVSEKFSADAVAARYIELIGRTV